MSVDCKAFKTAVWEALDGTTKYFLNNLRNFPFPRSLVSYPDPDFHSCADGLHHRYVSRSGDVIHPRNCENLGLGTRLHAACQQKSNMILRGGGGGIMSHTSYHISKQVLVHLCLGIFLKKNRLRPWRRGILHDKCIFLRQNSN